MHIPDGFLSLPVSVGTIGVSVAYGVYCHKKVKDKIQKQNIPLIACVTSFIFAAQMLNFPVLGGTSGHFMGATLATVIFGAPITFFMMTIVLLIQALLFGDGGLLAIGANVMNMAIIAPLVTAIIARKGSVSIFMASILSIVFASIFCSIQISLSGVIPFNKILIAMAGVHTVIGIGEGLITVTAVAFLKKINAIQRITDNAKV